MRASEVQITLHPLDPYRDLLIYYLGQDEYHGFEYTDTGLKAYIDERDFDVDRLRHTLVALDGKAEYSWEVINHPDINWNEKWESDFKPVELTKEIRIRAPFHQPDPAFRYELIIMPKMSFGTGHHATTSQMLSVMLQISFAGKTVLDMGSGTGVLAIMAEKLGAESCDAVDYDNWCYQNALENVQLNGCTKVNVIEGDVNAIAGKEYDVILANINRNILLADMQAYSNTLRTGGTLLMSGFYEEDLKDISAMAVSLMYTIEKHIVRDRWVCAQFVKN